MGKTFRAWAVDQVWLLPPSLQDLVPAGHLAHFVRDTVRHALDRSAIMAVYDEDRGYPPYHPGMMTALLLHGCCPGVHASRRIAQAGEERLDFAAPTGMQRPDFRTIGDFRKRHLQARSGLFAQVPGRCRPAGLTKLGHVALDGTKLKANASTHKAMRYGRMQAAGDRLAAEIAGWLHAAAASDAREDRQHGPGRRGDAMPDWVATKERRPAQIRAAKAAREAAAPAAAVPPAVGGDGAGGPSEPGRKAPPPRGVPDAKARRNFTDPESRIMQTKDGFIPGDNAQAAVDAASQVIVAQDLGRAGNDQRRLAPMLDAILGANGRDPEPLSADAGCCSADNPAGLDRRGPDGDIAVGRHKHGTPAATGATAAKPGTRVQAMQEKRRRGGFAGPYRPRTQTVEPVFGQVKQARGFRQLLLRGPDKVEAEWAMVGTAHNPLKLAAAA